MRVVAISDTHGEHRDVPYIPDGDVFIHAGDFLNFGQEKMAAFGDILGDFYKWIDHLPHKYKILVGGNHDHFLDKEPKRISELPCEYLQDVSIEIEGLKFYGAPWAPFLNGMGVFGVNRGPDIAEKWSLIPDDTDILITHSAPYMLGDKTYYTAEHVGCRDLRDRIEEVKPKLHLYGHIHAGGGFDEVVDNTRFVNVAYCKPVNIEATVIDI